MPAIITSRTRRLYGRPPGGITCLNNGSMQAAGLVCFVPLTEFGRTVKRDIIGQLAFSNSASAPTWVQSPALGPAIDCSGSTQFLSTSSTPVANAPLTLACWFNADSTTAVGPLVAVADNPTPGSQFSAFSVVANGAVASDPIQAVAFNRVAASSKGYVAGGPQHACAVFDSSTSRAAYYNGTNKGTNTGAATPTNIDAISIGGAIDIPSESSFYFNGRIAHVCIWSRALSDAEVYALYDPGTRWDLYYQLHNRIYSIPFASAGGFEDGVLACFLPVISTTAASYLAGARNSCVEQVSLACQGGVLLGGQNQSGTLHISHQSAGGILASGATPCLNSIIAGTVQQFSQGPSSPGTASNNASVGDFAWLNPTNVFTSNDGRAIATLSAGTTSQRLDITGFGFSIPAEATIHGIEVTVERSSNEGDAISDHTLQLLVAGSPTGDNKADTVTTYIDNDETIPYGGAADLWGTTLTPAEVNASDFGVTFRAKSVSEGIDARVDHVTITVFYSVVAEGVGASILAGGDTDGSLVVSSELAGKGIHSGASPLACLVTLGSFGSYLASGHSTGTIPVNLGAAGTTLATSNGDFLCVLTSGLAGSLVASGLCGGSVSLGGLFPGTSIHAGSCPLLLTLSGEQAATILAGGHVDGLASLFSSVQVGGGVVTDGDCPLLLTIVHSPAGSLSAAGYSAFALPITLVPLAAKSASGLTASSCSLTSSTHSTILSAGYSGLTCYVTNVSAGNLLLAAHQPSSLRLFSVPAGTYLAAGRASSSVLLVASPLGTLLPGGSLAGLVELLAAVQVGGSVQRSGHSSLLLTASGILASQLLAGGSDSGSLQLSSSPGGVILASGQSSHSLPLTLTPLGQRLVLGGTSILLDLSFSGVGLTESLLRAILQVFEEIGYIRRLQREVGFVSIGRKGDGFSTDEVSGV